MDMRRYFIFILACLLCLGLVSCGSGTEAVDTEVDTESNERFKETYYEYEGGVYTRILVDTETGVMYLYAKTGYGGGLTVMVDKDGKPLIWEEATK